MNDSDLSPVALWVLIGSIIVFLGAACAYLMRLGCEAVRTRRMMNEHTGKPMSDGEAVFWGGVLVVIGAAAGLLALFLVYVAIRQNVLHQSLMR